MPTFFDDGALHKLKLKITYLTSSSFDSAWLLLESSPALITQKELKNYILSVTNDYSFKYAAIALKQGQVLGIALFSDLDSEVFLNHLYVQPVARFQGVGSKLMKHIKQFAGSREITQIDTSSTYMPWMSSLDIKTKIDLSHRLGSFYN